MTSPRKSRDPNSLRPATQLVHGGSLRSRFEETSEALFLTQGYLYDTMEMAEARFKGDEPGFIYSRFSNPTVAMFEQPHGAARRRGGGARDRERHGGGDRGADGPGQGRRPRRRRPRPVRLVSLRGRGPAAALRRRIDPGRGDRPRRVAGGGAAEHQNGLYRNRRPTRRSKSSTSPPSPRSSTPSGRRWWSTTCSPRRSTSIR